MNESEEVLPRQFTPCCITCKEHPKRIGSGADELTSYGVYECKCGHVWQCRGNDIQPWRKIK